MHQRIRGLAAGAAAVIACAALAACGSSGGTDAGTLLKQTFSSSHTVNSGDLNVSLTVVPTGSSTITAPVTLSLTGPFQSLGQGKLPKSNFNISLSYQGQSRSIGILSTGTSGYVVLSGNSYQLPASTFQKLESSFASVASSPSGGPNGGTLAKLGIDPLHWLTRPSVIGNENVAGAATTHIHAGIDVPVLLTDLNTFLHKAASVGVTGASSIPTSIPASTRAKIASEVENPTFDVWTGTDDKILRKLSINLTLPVTGQTSTALGGLRSAAVGLSLQYRNLNQPQSIAAPTNVRPYDEFASQLKTFESDLLGTLGGITGASGSSGASASSPTATSGASPTATSGASPTATSGSESSSAGTTGAASSSSSGTPATSEAYSQCIQAAGGDVLKMQRCAPLLNSK